MGATLAAAVGTIMGVASCFPSAMLFERALKGSRAPSVAIGLVSMVVSFALLVGALVVIRLVSQESVLVFGCAEAASFLLVWVVEAWRAWRSANSFARPGERKKW